MDTWDKFGYDEHNRLIRIDSTNEEYVHYVRYEDMVNCVMNMPTAYDIDKVIAKLKELDVKSITRYKNGNFGNFDGIEYYIKQREAIEIVKQGSVSDDECEWNQNKGGVGLKAYKISCFGKTLEMPVSTARGLKYCPYCGNKIRIVGD